MGQGELQLSAGFDKGGRATANSGELAQEAVIDGGVYAHGKDAVIAQLVLQIFDDGRLIADFTVGQDDNDRHASGPRTVFGHDADGVLDGSLQFGAAPGDYPRKNLYPASSPASSASIK